MAIIQVKELTHLMNLLDIQEETLFAVVSESIKSHGLNAIPYLEAASEKSLDEIVQTRIKTLIKKIRIQNLYSELHNWAIIDSSDLLKGYFIISKYQFPDLDEARIMSKVEALKKEVWIELKQDMTPFEGAKVISKVFFELKQFSLVSDPGSYFDSMCLNTLLETKIGHPSAIALLYAGIAQRLGLQIYGVNLPLNGFLAYVQSSNHHTLDLKNDVMFYINPYAKGVFFPKASIYKELEKKYSNRIEEYTGACSNPKFISRILKDLQILYEDRKQKEKTEEINNLMKALEV